MLWFSFFIFSWRTKLNLVFTQTFVSLHQEFEATLGVEQMDVLKINGDDDDSSNKFSTKLTTKSFRPRLSAHDLLGPVE